MATYQESGVNMSLGDECSEIAYKAAKSTFIGRKGMFGEPLVMDWGFTGALDFGDFYLVQNDDGIGTKVLIADAVQKYDTLGYDLLAMVADDAICVGAEVISISNVIDIDKVEKDKIAALMSGLAKACLEQKIVIPGGEIGELGGMVNGFIWNATAVGVVEKNKFITCREIEPGDKIIGFRSRGFRSNGFTLVRYILNKELGGNWAKEKFSDNQNWGEAVLTPSIIYHNAILEMHGRFREPGKVKIKGVAHITGGGIPGNVIRMLEEKKLGAYLNNLPAPHEPMLRLQNMDTVKDVEAYKTWNMGVGMTLISNEVDKVMTIAEKYNLKAQVIGEVTKEPGITLVSQGFFEKGKELKF